MKMEQMRCFLALAEHHNFSVAADELYISQSTLSKQIQSMERELNVVLFERKARSVTLTAVGERIHFMMEQIVNSYDDMLSYLPDNREKEQQLLKVSSICDMSQYGITQMIIKFERENRGVIAETREQGHDSLAESLEQRRIQCAIGYRELIGNVTGYDIMTLKRDPLVLVYSKNHPLAKKDSPNLGDAKFYRFCFPKEDKSFFDHILRLCARVGFVPELTKSDVRISTIKEYILQGMRLTIITKSRAEHIFDSPEFVINPLTKADILHLALFVRSDVEEEMYQEFEEFAQKYFKDE